MSYRLAYLLFLLLIIFSQSVRAQGLQRLFMTAQERAALDAERLRPSPPKIVIPTATKKVSPPPPRYITFDGLVTRSNGPSTVWINGSNKLTQPAFTVELDKRTELSVPIVLSKSKRTIQLKPGQTVNTLDGTIKDNFEPR
jgi:hypothetical protein